MKNNKVLKILSVIFFIIIVGVVIILINSHKPEEVIEETNTVAKTLSVDGKEAKYIFLLNKKEEIYGIKFENMDVMEEIILLNVDENEEKDIKNLIINDGIYKFTDDDFYEVKIKTIEGNIMNTGTFQATVEQ